MWSRMNSRCRPRPGRGRRSRSWSTRGRRCSGWCRCRSTTRNRRLNSNRHRRSHLKEIDRRVCSLRRLIRVKSEIVQGAPANRIGVLIGRKSFRRPAQRIGSLVRYPWRAAVALVVQCAVVCPTGMLRRRVKTDVADIHSSSYGDTERLNRAIEVHVIESILIVPNPGRRVSYFVAHKPEAIVSRVRFQSIHRRACPSSDGRLHSHCVTDGGEKETSRTTHAVLAVGNLVRHVALSGMRLAPGEFARGHILRFSKVGRALIKRCVEVVGFHENPVRYAVVVVAAVIVRIRWKVASEWIDPGTRTDLGLVPI